TNATPRRSAPGPRPGSPSCRCRRRPGRRTYAGRPGRSAAGCPGPPAGAGSGGGRHSYHSRESILPTVCIVRLPLFCLSMSQYSQQSSGTASSLTHPHTSEFLHQHGPGAIVHRHSHDYHQLISVSTGVLAIHTEQGAWVASRDRAAWVPAGIWHEHRAYGPTSVHTIGFDSAKPPLQDKSPTIVAVDSRLRELFVAGTERGLPAGE